VKIMEIVLKSVVDYEQLLKSCPGGDQEEEDDGQPNWLLKICQGRRLGRGRR
jgi:hypothetical protein